MTTRAPAIINFKTNTLRAVFDLQLPSGLIICGAMLHQSHGKHWVGLPSKGYVKQDGTQGWSKVVDFADKQTHYRFQEIVAPIVIEAFERATGEVTA